MNLGTLFERSTARDPDATAIVDGAVRRTYGEWHGDICRMAGGLVERGLVPGDHVVAVMSNRFEMATLLWACQMAGLIFTPFNWRAGAADIAYVLADAEAGAVVFEDQVADNVAQAIESCAIDIPGERRINAGDAGGAAPVAGPVEVDDGATCLMIYTSGTTGAPKGVPRSHRAEYAAADACIAQQHYRPGNHALGVMPLFHTMGIRVLLMSAMLNGKFVCMGGFDAGAALDIIEAERISSLFLVPTMLHDMFEHPEFSSQRCASVSNVAYAGMLMTGTLEQRCRDLLNPDRFINYYGSSEIFTFTFCDRLDRKPGCAGRAGRGQEIRVVTADPDGGAGPDDQVAVGEIGEVIATMKSPEAFTGYWKRPDADASAIRDGWYFTGDLGRLDEDGDLFLAGRTDDMIISGGENIHPEEVEDVLSTSPLVAQAAVAGIDDPRWGQKVVAFIVPATGDAGPGALDEHCMASSLARFKRPKAYVFVEQLPQSASGKLLRRLLREGDYRVLPDYENTL